MPDINPDIIASAPRPIADQPSRPVAWSRYRDGVFVGIFEGPTDPRTVHDPGPRFEFRPLVEATTPPNSNAAAAYEHQRITLSPCPATIPVIAEAVAACAEAWDPAARLIGNVTAGDVARLARYAEAALYSRVEATTPPTIPADLRALLEEMVAADDEWHRPTASDDDLGSIEVKRDAIHDDIIAWTRAHAGER